MSWRRLEPSPYRGWIRWTPRSWPAPRQACFDLADRRIVWPADDEGEGTSLPDPLPSEPAVVYLPPAAAGRRKDAEALANRLCVEGFAPVVHGFGDGWPDLAATVRWLDPVAAWLAREDAGEWCRGWRADASTLHVALPLVPGLTPAGEQLEEWVEAIAAAAPRAVVGIAAELSPVDQRRLVDRLGESSFDDVFHGSVPAEQEVARLVAAMGLSSLAAPPEVPGLSPRAGRNRELACALVEAAELGLRLGGAESECAGYFAAARHLESTSLDVAAIAREGNLALLDWLTGAAHEFVSELLTAGSSTRLQHLRARWIGDGP